MQKIFTAIFILLSLQLFGQIDIINENRTDGSVNIFYIGIENLITLKTKKDLAGYGITVSGAGGALYKIDKGLYLIRVNKVDTCNLVITKNNRQLLTRKYITAPIAIPLATLNGFHDTSISKNKILLNPFLSIIIPDCYYKHNLRVLSFQATVIKNSDSTFSYSLDHHLSTNQLKLIRDLYHDDKIYFDQIRVSCPTGRTSTASPFWIKIE